MWFESLLGKKFPVFTDRNIVSVPKSYAITPYRGNGGKVPSFRTPIFDGSRLSSSR
jgi:hypothetical protein